MAVPVLFRMIGTAWLLTIAYVDARSAAIPNELTLPAVATLGSYRALRAAGRALQGAAVRLGGSDSAWVRWLTGDERAVHALVLMLVAWVFCFALWEVHILGGGDAKTLMGMFALLPSTDFAVFLAVAVLLLSVPLLCLKFRGKRLRDAMQAFGRRLREGNLMPTERRLEEEGRPYAWTFCFPGVVYLWLLW